MLRTQAPLVFINRVTPPPLSHLLVLTAAHCFEFITVSRLLHSLLPPSLSSPSVVPVLSPRKGQSHLQSYSLPESHRTRVREKGRNRGHIRQHHCIQVVCLTAKPLLHFCPAVRPCSGSCCPTYRQQHFLTVTAGQAHLPVGSHLHTAISSLQLQLH